jgi:UDP-N-acetylglucosamine enolpyruvyl transferase
MWARLAGFALDKFRHFTVGGTEHLMMAAATAGETTRSGEPKLWTLRKCSAGWSKGEGAGTDTIRIAGVSELQPFTRGYARPDRGGNFHDCLSHN